MRQSVLGFNQDKAIQSKLDLTDLMLLQYIMLANGTPDMKHIVKDDISYVWLSHSKIQEDLPILNIAEGTLRNKLYDLKKNNWIASETVRTSKGATTYYSISIKAMSLINDKDTENEEPCHSEMTCPCHSKMTSDNKLKDNKLNNNFTNVKLEQPTVTQQPKRRVRLVDTPNNSVNENTVKNTANQEKPKSNNLFINCLEEIDKFTDDEEIRDLLKTYLPIRLSRKDVAINLPSFRGMLKRLRRVASTREQQIESIQQSIDRQYPTFYEVRKYNNYKKKFAEGDGLKMGMSENEEIADEVF